MEFFKFLGIITMSSIGTILNGFALSKLWSWFIVETFGIIPIGIAQAIGISLIIGYITYQFIDTKPDDSKNNNEKLFTQAGITIARPLGVLLFGFIVHLFI